jgi:hypothetical protein
MTNTKADVELDGDGAKMVAISSSGDDRLYELSHGFDVLYAHVENGRLVPWQMTLSTGPTRPRPPQHGRWVEHREASSGVPLPRFLRRS